jgi:hypothetical protein
MSQEAKLLSMLRKAGKHGVPNYRFPEAKILRYSARIGDLRNEGYDIICERVKLPNGRSTGVFKYILVEPEEKKSLWQKLTG